MTKEDPKACTGPGFLGGGKRQPWIMDLGLMVPSCVPLGTPLSTVTCWHWVEDTPRKQKGAAIPLNHARPFLGTQESKPPRHGPFGDRWPRFTLNWLCMVFARTPFLSASMEEEEDVEEGERRRQRKRRNRRREKGGTERRGPVFSKGLQLG